MRTTSRVTILLGLLVGSGISAFADITWKLQDVDFSNGNQATGYFITNNAVNTVVSFSITVTGPATAATFTAASVASAYLPGVIGFASPGWTAYVDLYPSSPLTNAGGTIHLAGHDAWGDEYGVDCPGCGVIVDPNTAAVTTLPEPSAINLLGLFACVLGVTALCRRKRVQ
jgi:hypothetical protein